MIIQREFPEWSWSAFKGRIERLCELLRFRTELDKSSRVRSTTVAITDLVEIKKLPVADRSDRAIISAQTFRKRYPVETDEIRDIIERFPLAHHVLRLDDQQTKVLAGEAVFYVEEVSRFVGDQSQLEDDARIVFSTFAAVDVLEAATLPFKTAGEVLLERFAGRPH